MSEPVKLERLHPKEVAALLGLKNGRAVWRQAKAGRIPHVLVGNRRLYYRSTIMAWLEEQSASSIGKSAA